MSTASITRQELLQSFQTLENQFKTALTQAQTAEKDFDQELQKLGLKIAGQLVTAQARLSTTSPMRAQIDQFIAAVEKQGKDWGEKIQQRDKGVAFRAGFEDSMLVFVSGKVKSGKSSLGNYMAWGNTDPDDKIKIATPVHLMPRYQSMAQSSVSTEHGGDAAGEAEAKKEFRVGAIEATSSIQTFTIPGLTWVDSPGLHSVREENENLAKEYLGSADLVLYTIKSDEPGTREDFEEIKKLQENSKRFVMLLTGADDKDDDEDENGNLIKKIVMKSPEGRRAQEADIRSRFPELMEKQEILSISARYAQLHADKPAEFEDSGMGRFFAEMQRICQGEGVKIKRNVPLNNMRNFLSSTQADLKQFKDLLHSLEDQLITIERKLQSSLPAHLLKGQQEVGQAVDNYFESLSVKRSNRSAVQSELQNKFPDFMKEKMTQIGGAKVNLIFSEIMENFNKGVGAAFQSCHLDAPSFTVQEQTIQTVAGVKSGNKNASTGAGALIGGLIGLAVGGPAGAAIGAAIGGGVGRSAGNDDEIIYKNEKIHIGDNFSDIHLQCKQLSEDIFKKQVENIIQKQWRDQKTELENFLQNLHQDLQFFDVSISQKISSIDAALKE